jgi:hypothetical protein
VTSIPDAPGAEYGFQIPPNWPAPAGFDPRRGYVVDPTWPAPPPGWAFWFKAPVPVSARARSVSRGTVVRVVIGLLILGFVVVHIAGGSATGTDTGSCWRLDSGTSYTPVVCTDSAAQFRVISEVADPSSCPQTSSSYLDSNTIGASNRYRCLVPVTH